MVKTNLKRIKAVAFLVVLLLANVWSSYFYTRFDFTNEKRFTLTQKTKDILQNTNHEITITVFLDGEIPSAFKRLRNATKDVLNDYKAYAKAKINVVFENPLSEIPANEQDTVISNLLQIGIKPISVNIKNDEGITQKIIFPMAMVEMDGKQMPINLLQKVGGTATNYEDNINSSIQNLEYTFTSAIKRLKSGLNPKIGFTEGQGEPTNLYLYDAITTLSQNFYVGRVDLNLITKQGLDDLNVLFIAKPQKPFTEVEKYKINYFVMKGGKVVWAIDQVEAELDSMQRRGQAMATNRQLNLDDMLFEYGARINYNLIADLNCAMIPVATGLPGQQTQLDVAPWLYFPVLMPGSSALVKNIDGVRSQFTSTVDHIAVQNVAPTMVLFTSPYHKVFETPKMLSLQALSEQPNPAQFSNTPQAVGLLLEGNFKNVFLNRPVPTGISENYNLPEKSKHTKMLVIGDGDIFINQVSKTENTPFPLGQDRYTQQNFGNKALLLNIADDFTDEDNLIALRNKEIKVRLFDKTLLREQKLKWQLINLLLPILLLICSAIFQHYYRKYKYAK